MSFGWKFEGIHGHLPKRRLSASFRFTVSDCSLMRHLFSLPVFYTLIYGLLLLLVWYFVWYCGQGGVSGQLLHYDAQHYGDIVQRGYFGVNIAFFPLFPMLWRILSAGVEGACLLNLLIFMSGFVFLARAFHFSTQTILLSLGLPLNVFFYLPYSEAVFFFSSTLILAGLQQKNTALWMTGFFLATLARPAFTVLLPAFALVLSLTEQRRYAALMKMAFAMAATAAGMVIVGWVQYADTGAWFRFFSVQSEWDNYLRMPTLPLRSWGGDFSTRMDALAFFASLICGLALLPFILLRIKSPKAAITISSSLILSLAYCAGMGLLVLAFRGGSLFSLNRFVLATPFIMVLIHTWMDSYVAINRRQWIWLIVGSLFCWLLFASWTHISNFLAYGFLTVCIALFLWIKSPQKLLGQLAFASLMIIQGYFQFLLFERFLDNGWIG